MEQGGQKDSAPAADANKNGKEDEEDDPTKRLRGLTFVVAPERTAEDIASLRAHIDRAITMAEVGTLLCALLQ